MIAPNNNNPLESLLKRLNRIPREKLFFDDLDSTSELMSRCEISQNDIQGLMEILEVRLVDCDERLFSGLEKMPKPDGATSDWSGSGLLLATPTDEWIAPIVAWRALIHMRVESAIGLFFELLQVAPFVPRLPIAEEIVHYFALIGEFSFAPLQSFICSRQNSDDARILAIGAMGKLSESCQSLRESVIEFLIKELDNLDSDDFECNSEIVCVLLDLNADQAAAAIERSFSHNCIDVAVTGRWGDVREELNAESLGLPMPEEPLSSWTNDSE